METDRMAVVSWGLSDRELFSYYVFSGKYLIKGGHVPITRRPQSAFKILKSTFSRYGVEKVIIENNADLSRLKDYSDGFGSSERSRWEKKLRGVDIIMGMILEGRLGIKYEIKSLTNEVIPACKLGRFIKLSQDGEAIFEMLSIKIPQRLLKFVSEIYETVICSGVTVVKRLDENGKAHIKIGNTEVHVDSPVERARYVALWLRENGGSLEAIASFGGSRKEAESAHKRYVMSEMIKWINENSAIGLLLGTARLPVEDAVRLAEKLRDKLQLQSTTS